MREIIIISVWVALHLTVILLWFISSLPIAIYRLVYKGFLYLRKHIGEIE